MVYYLEMRDRRRHLPLFSPILGIFSECEGILRHPTSYQTRTRIVEEANCGYPFYVLPVSERRARLACLGEHLTTLIELFFR